MAVSHKDNAIEALTMVLDMLKGSEPLEGLRRHTVETTITYALVEVSAIHEVKRYRQKPLGVSE